jgi:inner membrane protein
MDTLTHALSGALLARATAPNEARVTLAARVVAGFGAAAFPDIDFVLAYISPVAYLTGHRGVTHSIVVLPLWALALAWLCAAIDRNHGVSWRDYFGVCALSLAAHILGDLITSFGTMIYAPLSDLRVAWGTTFIIDLWFSGIIVAGLAAAWHWQRSRIPAVAGLAVLVGYVGMQAWLRDQAIAVGEQYVGASRVGTVEIAALPRPVSPFNWMIVINEGNRYHHADVNLVRTAVPPVPGPDANLIARLDAAYLPVADAEWTTVEVYGDDAELQKQAERVLADARLDFFRWFAAYPALYRIDRGNPSTCFWFQDLRFAVTGREANPFRFGLCREDGQGEARVYRLRDGGARERAQ